MSTVSSTINTFIILTLNNIFDKMKDLQSMLLKKRKIKNNRGGTIKKKHIMYL